METSRIRIVTSSDELVTSDEGFEVVLTPGVDVSTDSSNRNSEPRLAVAHPYARLLSEATGEYLGDFEIANMAVDHALNEVGSFDFTVDSVMLHAYRIDLSVPMKAEVYYQGVMKASGPVDNVNVDIEGNYKITCNGQLDELARIRSKSNAKYQDQQVLAILLDLFDYAPGWTLGEIHSMEDLLVKTTIDLRGEKRLFAQVTKLLDAVPNTFLRHVGGQVIDIGKFDEHVDPLIPVDSIMSMTKKLGYSDLLRLIEPYGGEITVASVPRTINLDDALAYDAGLAADPDFPIVTDKGVKVVKNNALGTTGGSITDTFSEIVPTTKEDPPAADIKAAGYALYLRAKRELIDAATYDEEWSAETTFLPEGVQVGDRIFLSSQAHQAYYDYVTGRVIIVSIGQVSQWFRILSYSEKYSEKTGVTYDLKITPNLKVTTKDPILDLYDAAKAPVPTDSTAGSLTLRSFQVLSVTIAPGSPADCYTLNDDGTLYAGKLANMPLTGVPLGATGITWIKTPFSATDGVTVRIVSDPVVPSTAAVLCVSVNGNWATPNTLTLYGLVEYTT